MIIDRELLMPRKYIWVDGYMDVPYQIIIQQWKKYHFLFT